MPADDLRPYIDMLDPADSPSPLNLRAALEEMVAAYSAKPDTDEIDHPEGLTKEQVELAWSLWDLRQVKALGAARAALASSPAPAGPMTEEWGAMLEDIIGLWGTGDPDKDDVLDVLAEHRPYIASSPAPAGLREAVHDAIERIARAPDAGLLAALTLAISVLENYGDHHEWCARADGAAEPCSCGLWGELEGLRAARDRATRPAVDAAVPDDPPSPLTELAALLHNFDPEWCRHEDGSAFGECDARAKALMFAGVTLASSPAPAGLDGAIEAIRRVKASAIENGGRLTPGAILDVQTALNSLVATRPAEDAGERP